MKRLCYVSLVFIVFALGSWASSQKSAIVYYGEHISWPMLGVHDFIILETSHLDTHTHGFKRYKDRIYGYVSIGEVHRRHRLFKQVKEEWKIGKNETWSSVVTDISNRDYRKFLLDRIIEPLYRKGLKNFFLDTLDAFRICVDRKSHRIYEDGIVALIKAIKKRYPDVGIIINRGFDVIDRVHDDIDAVLFESYFHTLTRKDLVYTATQKRDREWLDAQLEKVRRYDIPIIDLEYLEDPFSREADETVRKAMEKGMIPYIADKDLTRYGQTVYKVLKRDVLMLYNGTDIAIDEAGVHLFDSLPLEYMGYRPVVRDIREGLPDGHLEDMYAGIVIQVDRPEEDASRVIQWIKKYAKRGLKTLILRDWPFEVNRQNLSELGIELTSNRCHENGFDIVEDHGHHFEIPVPLRRHDLLYKTGEGSAPTFVYKDGCGQNNTLASKMPWGGFILHESYLLKNDKFLIWTADPFKLFREYLGLVSLPVADPTTENGRRLLFTHLDGDGIMNRAEWNKKYSGAVIRDEILAKYKIPHSISVVVGEIAPNGLYPEKSKELMALARSIYAIPYVEAATHTFSHPFEWGKIDEKGDLDRKYRLDIPGYRFSLDYELRGSLEFITKKLLPEGKPPARTVFWSGDCAPPEKVLAYVYRYDLLNMNGGDTYITRDHPWLSLVSPFGIEKGRYYQIYTGEQNENVYTNEFHGPYWGFQKAIQTYQMTDAPRRFKPIDIYYHFYSGSKRASLRALKKVFDWATKQPTLPIYTTEYIPKAMDFYIASIAKDSHDGWIAAGMDTVRTLRFDGEVYPDISRSQGCVGYHQERNITYVAFDGRDRVYLKISSQPPRYAIDASNGRIRKYLKKERGVSTTLAAHVPLSSFWHIAPECQVKIRPRPDKIFRSGSTMKFSFKTNREANVDVLCP